MKSLMKYGLDEGKNSSYNSVEYSKVAADGKLYGIIREGTKYYIKVSPTTKSQLAENFDYIGGFANRKRNEFSSFANAQKQFDLKMMSINEASRNKINIDSWNPDAKEFLTVEATNKMKKEIQRERQIMKNASLIMEKKGVSECGVAECGNGFSECSGEGCKTTKVDKAAKDTQKTNIKDEGHPFGKPKDSVFTKKPSKKSLSVNEDVLGWNDDEDYLDTTHGTHVGKDDPFTIDDPDSNQKESMVEGVSMHDEDDQNTPTPGTNKNGKNIKWVKESIEDIEDGEDVEEGDGDTEYELETDDDIDADVEGLDDDVEDFDDDLEDFEDDEEEYDDSVNSRLDALEDKIDDILAAVGGDADYADYDTYEDDDLYDEDFDDDEEEEVYESRNYRNMMLKEGGMKRFSDKGRVPSGNMNPLNMFGKHPAYQKKVMTLPSHEHEEFDGYYDMNDDSVRNNKPYGEYIGSSAPFEVEPESIVNAIAESINRNLKKKA